MADLTLPTDSSGAEIVHVDDAPPAFAVRTLSEQEGFRRLANARMRNGVAPADPETSEARAERERREADVVDAARRSQAEIRRHVDSYLKEHFENIAADVASVVVDQIHARLSRGLAAQQEAQAFALDRIAADVRAQLRAFTRSAWGKPTTAKQAQRAPKGRPRAPKK